MILQVGIPHLSPMLRITVETLVHQKRGIKSPWAMCVRTREVQMSARFRLDSHSLHVSRVFVHMYVNTVRKIQRTSTLWSMFGLNHPDKGYLTHTGTHEV